MKYGYSTGTLSLVRQFGRWSLFYIVESFIRAPSRTSSASTAAFHGRLRFLRCKLESLRFLCNFSKKLALMSPVTYSPVAAQRLGQPPRTSRDALALQDVPITFGD